MKRLRLVITVAVCLVILGAQVAAQGGNQHWVGTWATAVVARAQGAPGGGGGRAAGAAPTPGQAPAGQPATTPNPPAPAAAPAAAAPGQAPTGPPAAGPAGPGRGGVPPITFNDQTLRQIVRTSIGGDRIRVVFSNAFGTAPLPVGAAHVALREKDSKVVATSGRPLTFNGSTSTTIAAGAVLLSDPVDLTVPPFGELAIDLYLPGDVQATVSTLTTHAGALQTNYVSPAGNHTGTVDMPVMTTTAAWFFLARVEVLAPREAGALVAFGDSITDGTRSTPNTNNRWPDHFAKRLASQNLRMGVMNLGIAGNRVLGDGAGVSALARFDRDVLVQPGVTHVVLLESINDIGLARANPSPTVDDLIAGHKQLIERAHARGLKIYGATLTPFEGAAYWTKEGEAKRQAVNEWIRTGKAYDGVVDFDAAVRDPNSPTKLRQEFNPGDNLHMNDAGYEAMANAIDLALFRTTRRN
jgi:lysophospholipase L1-like esterase